MLTPKQQTRTKSQASLDLLLNLTFFAQGVSSNLGWNTVLTSLDYFNTQYQGEYNLRLKGYNVEFLLPVPTFVSYFFVSLFLPKLSKILPLNFRIVGCLTLVCIILLILPLLATMQANKNGFIATMILVFLLNSFNSIQNNSALAISNVLGSQYINIFLMGNGFSGIIICTIRIVCLLVIKENVGTSALVYFCSAALVNVISIFLFILLSQSEQNEQLFNSGDASPSQNRSSPRHFYDFNKSYNSSPIVRLGDIEMKHILNIPLMSMKKLELDDLQNESLFDRVKEQELKEDLSQQKEYEEQKIQIQISRMNILQIVVYINKLCYPIPPLVTLIYVQTLMMFPGLALAVNFQGKFQTWGPLMIILSFNLCDSLGKYCAGGRSFYSEQRQIKMLLSRFGNFIIFILIAREVIQSYWFIFTNIILFSFTNGYTTNGLMQIGQEKVDVYLRDKVGIVQGFHLCLGLMLGTIFSLPLQIIKK